MESCWSDILLASATSSLIATTDGTLPVYLYLVDNNGIMLSKWIEQLSQEPITQLGQLSISGTNTGSASWYTTVTGFSDKYCLTPAESKLDNLDLWILSLSSLPDEWLYIVNN